VNSDPNVQWPEGIGEGTLLDHTGWFDEPLLESAGKSLREKMEGEGVDPYKPRDIFSVYVELVQNILRYSDVVSDESESRRFGGIRVGRKDGRVFVAAQNKISDASVAAMRTRLENLNQMDETQLKDLYKSRLRDEPEPGSKGASVGLIQIARQASEPLEFDFSPAADGGTLFTLMVTL